MSRFTRARWSCSFPADGLRPAQRATGLIAVGRARYTVDNTSGANGAKAVEVDKGTFRWANDAANPIAQANVGGEAYVLDDNTVSLLGTGRSVAGIIFQVDAVGVWVTVTP